jgi:hypothetical protein
MSSRDSVEKRYETALTANGIARAQPVERAPERRAAEADDRASRLPGSGGGRELGRRDHRA